uniref:DUF4268 domain-containing protein n=1 Tax=Klebsiella pneumoniae TaxID=573 RepID=A0A7T8TJ03_KLEPN|nr:DUF4268 domain-containing protein [Klebsiella pneumoniae]
MLQSDAVPLCRGCFFVDIRQVIPTPEAESYMIGMAQKEAEEQSTSSSSELQQRHYLRREFWSLALEKNSVPAHVHYLTTEHLRQTIGWQRVRGLVACLFEVIFSQKDARIQLNISRSDAVENTWLFERLSERKTHIESQFGGMLNWRLLPEKKKLPGCLCKKHLTAETKNFGLTSLAG